MNTSTTQRASRTGFFSLFTKGSSIDRSTSPSHKKNMKTYRFVKTEVIENYDSTLDKYIREKIMGGEDINTDGVKSLLKEFILQPRFAHGEIIKEGEPYFRCLDCEVIKNTSQRTYYCRSCFEKSNHKGHRFLLFNDATGYETCDCGNDSLLDPRFFCPDHGACSKDDYNRVISVIPPTFMKNFNKVLKQIIYELSFSYEAFRRGSVGNIRSFLDTLTQALLIVIRYCINLNPIFIVLISEIITQPMKGPKNFKKRFFFIEGQYVKHNKNFIEEGLNLTYLENLIRYSGMFRDEYQKQFRELLLKLATAEEFKKKLVLSFHKVAHHLFEVKPYTAFQFSDVAFLTSQIYASEQNCMKVIKEGTFDKLINVLIRYAKSFEPNCDPESEVLARCLHPFELILEKENPGRQLIQKEGVVGQFMSVIAELQKATSYDIKSLALKLLDTEMSDEVLAYWDLEENVFGIMERIARNAGYILDQIGWDQDPGLFLIDWGEKAQEDFEQNRDVTKIHLNIPLQRSMMAYLQNSLDRIEQDKIMKHLEYIRRSCPDAIEYLVGQSIMAIGSMRQSLMRLNGKNLDSNSVVHRYFIQDGFGDFSYFDYDFTFTQLFSLVLDESETNMFELYYKNFLCHDSGLINLFKNANFGDASEQEVNIFGDFLNFLVQLLHGEISFFNIFYKSNNLTDHVSKKVLDKIHRKILITFLHKTYNYSPITALKQDFRYILKQDIFHEKILKDIADVDKESKTFKLKKLYQDLFDAFYLYTDPLTSEKITTNVRIHNKNPAIAELGNFTQNLPFLEILQKTLYEGDLVDWIAKFFANFTPKSAVMVPAVARLIMLPLKLLERAKQISLSRRFKEKVVLTFFATKNLYESLKKALTMVEDNNIKNILVKLINIFIPNSNIGNTIQSIIAGSEMPSMPIFDPMSSMDPSELHKALELQKSLEPVVQEWSEGELKCGLCHGAVDLASEDVGVPTYISRSNVNFWELASGKKFHHPKPNADRDTVALIIYLIKRYWPYATGLHPSEVDFSDGYVVPKLKLDFYPALTSCQHYLHRSCFNRAYQLVPGSAQEFECPICRKLNNAFIGMEKVDAASREILQEQTKKNKKFLNFLKKQGVVISMLPDPSLRFDFYNNFMFALFPKNSTLELKFNDPAADRKILKFTSLMRTSFFQLVRNSMIYDFDKFIARSYMCYKFAFVNLQSFVMKNYQFHQFFQDFNNKVAPTIFHILNHEGLMEGDEPPTMKQLYDAYKGAFGLEHEQEMIQIKETKEKEKEKQRKYPSMAKTAKIAIEKHDHSRKLPKIPMDHKKKPFDSFKMNRRNRLIMMAYDFQANNLNKMNEQVFENQQIMARSMLNTRSHFNTMGDMTGSFDKNLEGGRARGSVPEVPEDYKEEELFDTLQKMMLLLESETEEDFLLAFWESFIRFMLSNKMKDKETNLDLNMLAIDFLYLRTLGLFTRTMLSERMLKMKQNKIPSFEEMCRFINENAELRADFVNEMLNLTQRIIVSSVIIFDFDKCLEILGSLNYLESLRGEKEQLLNKLLGYLRPDLTVDIILSPEIMNLGRPYKNFFYVWRENMVDFLQKTRNPFELFVKNVTEIKPLVVNLPSNFNEFNSEYLPKRCDICKEFCEYCKTVVCLLCGKVMCRDKCLKAHLKKDRKKRRRRAGKKRKVMIHQQLEDSDSESYIDPNSFDTFEEGVMAPVKPRLFTPKDNRVPSRSVRVRVKPATSQGPREVPIDIMVGGQPSVENEMAKTAQLPLMSNGEFQTPLKPLKPIEESTRRGSTQASSEANLFRTRRIRMPGVQGKAENHPVRSETPVTNTLTIRSTDIETNTNHTFTPPPQSLNDFGAMTIYGSDKEESSNMLGTIVQQRKRKIKRKLKHGNLHKHAEECHKGHAVYIGVQDQSIILFSSKREVKYFEKLYVDRFGQALQDKPNVFDQDWNSFELNPYVLKRLRDAVENHSLPQLTFSLLMGEIRPH